MYIVETLNNLIHQTAFFNLEVGNYVMIVVALVFLYLAIGKGFEPLLLVPIAFGMLLVNIYPDIMAEYGEGGAGGGLLYYFYKLDEWAILPSLIFMGVGAMTDFGPLIANPKSFLLGAAAVIVVLGGQAEVLVLLGGQVGLGGLQLGGEQGGLVEQVLQVRAGEAAGGLGDLGQVHVVPQGLLLGVDLQNLLPAPDIGEPHINLPVKAAGTQQGGVQNVLAVGGGHDDDPLVGGKTVHLRKKLVQSLLPLLVAAAVLRVTASADGVDLINKDDTRCFLFSLAEKIAYARSADAYEHLHEIGT